MSKKFLQSTGYSFLSLLSTLVTNFAAFLILIRLLPEYDFGVWVLFTGLTAFTDSARSGMIQNGLIKYMQVSTEGEAEVGKSALLLSILCSAGGALMLFLLSFPLSYLWQTSELPLLATCYLVLSPMTGMLKFAEFYQIGKSQFKGIFWSNLIYGTIFLTGIVALWIFGSGALLMSIIGLQILATFGATVFIFQLRKELFQPIWAAKYQADWTKKLFNFGKYVFGTNFSSMLFNKTDILMLGFFLNPMAVAAYSLAVRLSAYLEIPVNAVAQVIYPKIAAIDYETDKDEIIQLYEQSIGILLFIILPASAFVFCFAEPIILLISGGKYQEAIPVLQIFLLAGIIKPWGRLFGITLDAIGKPKVNFRMLIFSLCVNIVLNVILIPQLGIYGAAVATGLSIWITIIVGQFYLADILQINHWRIFRRLSQVTKIYHSTN